MNFVQQFQAARRVSTPLINIHTFDAASTVANIKSILGKKLEETPIIEWDCVHGMRSATAKGKEQLQVLLYDKVSRETQEQTASVPFTSTLEMAERATKDLILIIKNAHLQWTGDASTAIQGIWNLRDDFKANGNMLVLLTAPGSQIPTELVSDVLTLDEPLPTLAQLEAVVNTTFDAAGLDAADKDLMNLCTDALIGLPAFPAEQAVAMCIDRKTKSIDTHELWDRKRNIISQSPGLSVWDGKEKLEDIGGVTQVKNFMTQIMNGEEPPKTIIFIDEIEKAFAGTGTETSGVKTELTGAMLQWMQNTDMDGVIFIGLHGVSKSQLAKASGGSYGKPVINFDLAGMQSGLVGSSNANLRQAQATVDAISGGRVLAIATCNSIGALPPELRRRFNLGIFFFDSPSSEERAAIWDIYIKKYAISADRAKRNFNDDGWTGAEIKECCKKAHRMRLTLAEASTYIVPVTTSSADLIYNLRANSSGKYLSASKPGVYHYSETSADHLPEAKVVTGRTMRED